MAAAAVAFVVVAGSAFSPAVSGETNSLTAEMPGADTATADPSLFIGNAELKARLDLPGKLTVAGERLHVWLLRRFYAAHGYQTMWDAHPAEAGRLVKDAVLHAGEHGLDPGLFHSGALGERGLKSRLLRESGAGSGVHPAAVEDPCGAHLFPGRV